jgi:hypothetical protein
LQGFLRLAEVAFEAPRLLPRAEAVALEFGELPLFERFFDRPELARCCCDFPAVALVERGAAFRAAPPVRGELLRREEERLEVLEAPPLGFFFWP